MFQGYLFIWLRKCFVETERYAMLVDITACPFTQNLKLSASTKHITIQSEPHPATDR